MGTQQMTPDAGVDGGGWEPGTRAVARVRRRRNAASRTSSDVKDQQLSNFLGWFSIGLGLAQIVAPRGVARMIGIEEDGGSAAVMRACGLREITAGVGILTQPQTDAWLWARVAGDVLDLALLGKAMASEENDRGRLAFAAASVVGVGIADVLAGQKMSRAAATAADDSQPQDTRRRTGALQANAWVTVQCSADQAYRFWRDPRNLARAMTHLASVEATGDRTARWRVREPGGITIQWEAEVVEDHPGELIAWRSLPGADVPNRGAVQFAQASGGRGTEIRLEMDFSPPGGVVTATLARLLKLFGNDPETQMRRDLRDVKQMLEVGEVVKSDATAVPGPHAAQPTGNGR